MGTAYPTPGLADQYACKKPQIPREPGIEGVAEREWWNKSSGGPGSSVKKADRAAETLRRPRILGQESFSREGNTL